MGCPTASTGATTPVTDPIPAESAESLKEFTGFSLNVTGATARIHKENFTVQTSVPASTDLTNIVPFFTYRGASITAGSTPQVSGKTANNFESPVVYTITAADASTQDWTVSVNYQRER